MGSKGPPLTWYLIAAYVLTFFIPEEFAIQLGTLTLTPNMVAAMLLFPVLLLTGRVRWVWPDGLVVVVLLVFLGTYLNSSELSRAVEGWGRIFLMSVAPYMLGRYVTQNVIRLRAFLTLLITGMGVMAVFLLIESLSGFNIHATIWQVPHWEYPNKRLGLIRARGFTAHPIMSGLVYMALLPLALVVCKEKINVLGRHPKLKTLGLGIGVFLSLSTGVWVPAALGVALIFYDYWFRIGAALKWTIVWVGGPLMYFMLEVVANRPLLRIMMMKLHLTSPDAWHYRWMLYQRVYSVMPGHWFAGYGFNVPEEFLGWGYSIDNNYLVVLLKHGQIGLTVWILLMVLVILYGGRAVWGTNTGPLFRLARAMMLAIPLIGLAQLTVALFSQGALMFWLTLGMSVGMAQACKQSRLVAAKMKRRRGAAKSVPAGAVVKASA